MLQRAPMAGPGAGTYEIDAGFGLTESRIRFGRMGTGLRQSAELNHFPGPGAYECAKDQFLHTHRKPRVTVFDKKVRDSIAQATDVPGPGSYISKLDLDSGVPMYQKISIKRKYGDTNKNVSPGPVFEISAPARKLKLKSPSYRIGTGPKIEVNPQMVNENPGPGQYNPFLEGVSAIIGRKKHRSFARSIRELSKSLNMTPGPGEYLLPAKFCELQPYQIPKSKRIT